MRFNKVLTVCTGNICRSPLAKGLLQKELPKLNVDSAGIAAVVGGVMPEHARVIAEREGFDLTGHCGKQCSVWVVEAADIVLVMEQGQLDWITRKFPQVRGRVFLVTHWTDQQDIADPYQHDAESYERSYAHLAAGIKAWAERLK